MGVVFGLLEASGDTFGWSWRVFGHLFWYLGRSLGHFFWSCRLLGAPWVSKWILEPTFLDFGGFWAPFWEAFGRPGGVWEVIWEPFGGLWEVFGCFFGVLSWKV